jgi:hypothetical protein
MYNVWTNLAKFSDCSFVVMLLPGMQKKDAVAVKNAAVHHYALQPKRYI